MLKRVYIEITNICNLSCAFCAKNDRTPLSMSPSNFSLILDKIKPICNYIYLHVQGEPMLHPQFDELLSIADEKGFQVQLVTNGSFINEDTDIYKHPSLRKVSISLHSIDYQTTDCETYYKNILSFVKKCSLQGHPYCELRFWVIDQLKDNAQKMLTKLETEYSFLDTKKKNSYELMPNVYVSFDNKFDWPGTGEANEKGTCHGAIDMCAILVDGTVVPCCLDYNGKINLGNINKVDLLSDIINTDRYQSIIKGFQQNKLVETLCQNCTYCRRFKI